MIARGWKKKRLRKEEEEEEKVKVIFLGLLEDFLEMLDGGSDGGNI